MTNLDCKQLEGVKIQLIPLHMQHLWMKNYSYVLLNLQAKEALVIDPAWEMGKIEKALRDFTLTGILLTHAHEDHTDLVTPLVKKYRCPVWMSKEEIVH